MLCLTYIPTYLYTCNGRGIRPPLNSGLMTVLSEPGQFLAFGNSLPSFFNHEWKTEKRHDCANMGKVKDSNYDGNCTSRDLENFRMMNFCWTECTCSWKSSCVTLLILIMIWILQCVCILSRIYSFLYVLNGCKMDWLRHKKSILKT